MKNRLFRMTAIVLTMITWTTIFHASALETVTSYNSQYLGVRSTIQIKVDGVITASDVAPELLNDRTMVPLRVICENLGIKVDWLSSGAVLSKTDMKIVVKVNSRTVVSNDAIILLDDEPYLKNNRIMVPLRFIAEAFGCDVNYENRIVTVDTEPLIIHGTPVKVLQNEFHMTMGGLVQQIEGNAYITSIYDMFIEKRGKSTTAPANYSWRGDMDTIGSYYKNAQFDFLDSHDKSIQRFEVYTLLGFNPSETLSDYPKVLLYDATANLWYLVSDSAVQSLTQLIETVDKNGFLKIISNTIV